MTKTQSNVVDDDTADETTEPPVFDASPDSADVAVGSDPAVEVGSLESDEPEGDLGSASGRTITWAKVVTYALLPGVALLLTLGIGYLKWTATEARNDAAAVPAAIQAAKDSTVALLSYQPDTVQQQLTAAKDRLTGSFRDSYSSLIHDVVIPGAQQQRISAVASIPAAAIVSSNENHAEVLLFINQQLSVGQNPPSATRSTVLVTVDKVDGRWLISDFQPK